MDSGALSRLRSDAHFTMHQPDFRRVRHTAPYMGNGAAQIVSGLKIFRAKARLFGDACQHARAHFLPVMDCENEIGSFFSGQRTV